MTHSLSTSPPLLNPYFKLKTQRLEICKNFWKGHSINWTSGHFFDLQFLSGFSVFPPWGRCSEAGPVSAGLCSRLPPDCSGMLSSPRSPHWLTHTSSADGFAGCFPQQRSNCCYWSSSSCFQPHPRYVQINLLVLMTVLLYHLLRFVCIL